jgi:hypothetical protein
MQGFFYLAGQMLTPCSRRLFGRHSSRPEGWFSRLRLRFVGCASNSRGALRACTIFTFGPEHGFTFASDQGDFVGRGNLTLRNATFRATLGRAGGRLTVVMQRNDVPVTDPSRVTTLAIWAPFGASLAASSYDTVSSGERSSVGLSVGANGVRCTEAIGRGGQMELERDVLVFPRVRSHPFPVPCDRRVTPM